MKLYAVRDRLIDYFLRPFPADTDKQVLASCATAINNEANNDPIAQTPNHFELWRLADINEETGKVTGEPEFLADCASLVRPSVRERGTGGSTENAPDGLEDLRNTPAASVAEIRDALQRAPENPTQAKNRQRAEINPRPERTA